MAFLQSKQELDDLRFSSRILVSCLRRLRDMTKPGVSAGELNREAERFIRSHGGEPSFLGHEGYPYTLCVSINDEVVHGICSDDKLIPDNAIVSLDCGVCYNGMFSDSAITFAVGTVSSEAERLMKYTFEALMEGIKQVKPGARIGDIGYAIDGVAKKQGFGNVYELGGHGVGRAVWEEPFIPNIGQRGKGARLFEHQVLAIEPMFTTGSGAVTFDSSLKDGWTVRTKDGSLSAHYEHTILITKDGPEILTEYASDQLLN